MGKEKNCEKWEKETGEKEGKKTGKVPLTSYLLLSNPQL